MKKNLINALTFVAVATMLFLKANSAPQKGMNDTILDNVEALANGEWIDPKKYCKQAGGICYLNIENIVYGLQIEDKKE